MYLQFGAVLVFIVLGLLFIFGNLFIGALVRLRRPGREKDSVYECGEPTIGTPWVRFNSRFYNIALVYLLFDVEVVLLVPAALAFRDLAATGAGLIPLLGLMAFLFLLALGLAYEWFYGNLDWISSAESPLAAEGDPTPEQGGGRA